MTSRIIAVVMLVAMLAQTARADPPAIPEQHGALQPVPDARAQAAALAKLKDIYKPYPPAKAEDKTALAKKLLDMSQDAGKDPAGQYVMMSQAAEMASAGGDYQTAVRAVDQQATLFAISPEREKLAVLKGAANARLSPTDAAALCNVAIAIGWRAMRGGDAEGATRAAALAAKIAPAAQDPKLAAAAKTLTSDAGKYKNELERYQSAEAKLKANGDDPAAALVAGRFLCLWRGDWHAGLPLLATCADAALKAVATDELARPAMPDQQFALAERWYTMAGRETGMPHSQLLQHAARWYTQAAPALAGLQKTLADQRIAEARADDQSGRDSFGTLDLALTRLLNDPEHWTIQSGKWKNVKGKLHGEGASGIELDTPLPARITFSMRINVISGMRPRISLSGTDISFGNEGYSKTLYPHGTKASEPPFPYENNQPHLLTFNIAGDHFEIAIDRKPAFKGTCKAASEIRLKLSGGDGWSAGTTEFSDFEVMAQTADAPAEKEQITQ